MKIKNSSQKWRWLGRNLFLPTFWAPRWSFNLSSSIHPTPSSLSRTGTSPKENFQQGHWGRVVFPSGPTSPVGAALSQQGGTRPCGGAAARWAQGCHCIAAGPETPREGPEHCPGPGELGGNLEGAVGRGWEAGEIMETDGCLLPHPARAQV